MQGQSDNLIALVHGTYASLCIIQGAVDMYTCMYMVAFCSYTFQNSNEVLNPQHVLNTRVQILKCTHYWCTEDFRQKNLTLTSAIITDEAAHPQVGMGEQDCFDSKFSQLGCLCMASSSAVYAVTPMSYHPVSWSIADIDGREKAGLLW